MDPCPDNLDHVCGGERESVPLAGELEPAHLGCHEVLKEPRSRLWRLGFRQVLARLGVAKCLVAVALVTGCTRVVPPEEIGLELFLSTSEVVVDAGTNLTAIVTREIFPYVSARMSETPDWELDRNVHTDAIQISPDHPIIWRLLEGNGGISPLFGPNWSLHRLSAGRYPVRVDVTVQLFTRGDGTNIVRAHSTARTNFTIVVTSSFVPPEPDPEPPPPPAFTNLMSFGGGIAHPPWCLAEGTDGLLDRKSVV